MAAPLEQVSVLPGLFQAMGDNASYFNASFTTWDFATSFFYNGVMWAVAVIAFHVMHPRLAGGWLAKSLQAAIAFTVVALANAVLYPRLVGRSVSAGAR